MEWKPIKNYEDIYEISEFGDVRSIDRTEIQPEKRRGNQIVKSFKRFRKGRPIKPNLTPSKDRYLVELNKNGVKKCLVHRLVYESFIGKLEQDKIIHHKDCNKFNNHYSNLQQVDFIEHNNIHAHEAWNKGIKNPEYMINNIKKTKRNKKIKKALLIKQMQDEGLKLKEIANKMSLCERQISEYLKTAKDHTRAMFDLNTMPVS